VFDALDEHGEEARLLAGGQSLMPALNMRLAQPAILVDINHVAELRGIAEAGGGRIRIGALTRHAELGRAALVRERLGLLHDAVPHIAHPAIRNRGTFGGSLALADPAAELPACAVALGAEILLASRRGLRRVQAAEFFRGLYETARRPDEVVAGAEFPPARGGERSVFLELARRRGDYAMVGLAARATVDGGVARDLRLVFLGVAAKPALAGAAAAAASGRKPAEAIPAAQEALAGDLDPVGDLHADPATKLHLARMLLGSALRALAA
jgi:carbon-monoxide dehydrogenase medium subunit